MTARDAMRLCFFGVTLIGFLYGEILLADEPPAARPNIVFIFSDDHATNAVGAYGGRLARLDPTPHIDKLAREGIRFDRAFVTNSICAPSRATLLTGQYSHLNGVRNFDAFDPKRPTFPALLQKAGYYTAIVGKWHLESNPVGFDEWEILPGQGAYWNPMLYTAQGQQKHTGHASDVISDLSIKRLESRPADKPFLLMVHHKAPHRNWQPHSRHAGKYKHLEIPEPDNLFDNYATRTDAIREQKQSIARDLNLNDLKDAPPADLSADALVRWKYQRYMQDYLACVQGVDDSVGRIVEWLDTHGLRENTLVIYSSDQGFFLGEHGLFDKRFIYEEALRMPLVIRWPAVIKPESKCDAMVINCDFAPTFLQLAQAESLPEMQGRSIVPLLRGERPANWRTAFYYRYYHDPGDHNTRAHYGIRTETHKLTRFWKKRQWECYDLVNDPAEMKNLYADPAVAAVVEGLRTRLAELQLQLRDQE